MTYNYQNNNAKATHANSMINNQQKTKQAMVLL